VRAGPFGRRLPRGCSVPLVSGLRCGPSTFGGSAGRSVGGTRPDPSLPCTRRVPEGRRQPRGRAPRGFQGRAPCPPLDGDARRPGGGPVGVGLRGLVRCSRRCVRGSRRPAPARRSCEAFPVPVAAPALARSLRGCRSPHARVALLLRGGSPEGFVSRRHGRGGGRVGTPGPHRHEDEGHCCQPDPPHSRSPPARHLNEHRPPGCRVAAQGLVPGVQQVI
jgi:hypothetical protein